MRNLILKDTKIDKDELLKFVDDYADFFEENAGITPVTWVEQHDFSHVPTKPDSDGDLKPTEEYVTKLLKGVHDRYNDYGVDNVIMLVHEDNFLFKGIWGQNWSYKYHQYCFQLCRWDKRNSANSFGTFYHEQMHSFDAVIQKEIGVDINKVLKIDWDKFIVHGGRPDAEGTTKWKYIRYKENVEALKEIADLLERAYKARQDKHDKHTSLLKTLLSVLSTYISLLKKVKGVK